MTPAETGPRGRVLLAAGPAVGGPSTSGALARDGLVVDVAPDGAGALSALRAARYDVVLLDVALPGPDVVDVVDAVRCDPATAGTTVVAVGAPEDERAMLRCLDAGADDVLWTPVDPAALRARTGAGLARAWVRERERECREQVSRLTAAFGGGEVGGEGDGDPFGRLIRLLSRAAEQAREREHRLRRPAGVRPVGERTGHGGR